MSIAAELVDTASRCVPAPIRAALAVTCEESPAQAVEDLTAALVAHQDPPRLTPPPPRPGGVAAVCRRCPHRQVCGGHPDGCAWQHCDTDCARCPVRCPDRADIAVWDHDVGGLGLDDRPVTCDLQVPPPMPAVVPVIEAGALTGELASRWPAWGISISRIHSARTGRVWPSWADGTRAQALHDLGVEVLIVEGVATDDRLIKGWAQLRRGVTGTGFDVYATPAWSVYDDDPRLEHLFAIRQSALVAAATARRTSAPVVATVHWRTRRDLDRQLAWVDRCGGGAVAIDASTLHSAAAWIEVRAALAYVVAMLGNVTLHVTGPATSDRLDDLAGLGAGRVVVHTSRPAALARAHRYLDGDLTEQDRPFGWSPADCLMGSVGSMTARLTAGG